ncbi:MULTISPECIES: hypothetical protein [Paenibacillus]|uniref:Uncharacterized protein n=1 Tax=Paenibacillus residui TaxID=629724 RepID=A0ABW3DAD6_9BACL|nr:MULTISPECIES: hypothetical protein [Paenibacillaceae]
MKKLAGLFVITALVFNLSTVSPNSDDYCMGFFSECPLPPCDSFWHCP